MSKFISRETFVAATGYAGATAMSHRGLLWDALRTRLGLTDTNRTTVTATGALTVDQCGPLLVDATAGAVVLTLPASGSAADEAVYEIDRIDATAYTVTVAAAGADTIDGAASVTVTGTMTLRLPAGSTVWRVHSISGATPAEVRRAIGAASLDAAPPGMIAMFAMTSAPTGWLKNNGALVSRTAYAALFAKIGTTWGAGDGVTTFALPDDRGEFWRGLDDGRGVDPGRALASGQTGQNEAHTHTLSARSYVYERGSGGTGGYGAGTVLDREAGGVTAVSGGSENRVRNVAYLSCIKY